MQKLMKQFHTKDKEASMGPLESDNEWKDWYPKFTNDLSTLIGVNKIPLSYVVRENDNTDAKE